MPKPYLRGFGFFIEKGGIDMCKAESRKQMITRLKTMTQEEYAELSKEINEKLINIDEFINAKMIGITVSRYPEVNTRIIIETAWAMGKQVAVPKCDAQKRMMDFRLITSFDQLETVYMDLLEPKIGETTSVLKGQVDLQIVPGVVFSTAGYRIGFGGGYYDRYLMDYQGDTVALAFDCQIDQAVPIELHDLPVEKVITEKRCIDCKEIRESK